MNAARRAACAVLGLAVLFAAGCGRPQQTQRPSDTTSPAAAGTSATKPVAGKGDLQITRPYLPRPPLRDMAALYFTVGNTGTHPDYLDRVQAPGLARDAMLHTTRHDTMVPVPAYRIPGRGRLVLQPGGNHVMLIHLTRMPTIGTQITAQLFFRHAGEIDVRVPVVAQTSLPTGTHAQGTPGSTGAGASR